MAAFCPSRRPTAADASSAYLSHPGTGAVLPHVGPQPPPGKSGHLRVTKADRVHAEEAHLIGDPTLLTALEALLNVLPPGVSLAGRKKPDANLTGAANDFEALERLRRLAFAETVPAPKIPEQLPLELPDATDDNEEV